MAADRGVSVSFVPLQNRIVPDAYVQAINLPRRARTGEKITVDARILSNHAAPVEVRGCCAASALSSGGPSDLAVGDNHAEFETTTVGRGVYTYSVQVADELDQDPANDRMGGQIEVLGRPAGPVRFRQPRARRGGRRGVDCGGHPASSPRRWRRSRRGSASLTTST